MKKVFVTREIVDAGIKLLESKGFEVEVYEGKGSIPQELLIEKAKSSNALITMLSDKIDESFLRSNSHLKVIANYAVGFNNIDIASAKELNIKIGNTPDVLSNATAELALGLMFDVARRISESKESIYKGEWIGFEPMGFLGSSLSGKTLGIVGMGRIGQCLAQKGHALGMKVIYTARSPKEDIDYATQVSFDELLEKSDFVSVHCPLTDSTKNLFNKDAFNKMKQGAYFINTSRGEVCDQTALYEALVNGEIRAAALDVTTPEPINLDNPLLKLANCTIIPHIGSADIETRTEMSLLAARNIIAVFDDQEMPAQVR